MDSISVSADDSADRRPRAELLYVDDEPSNLALFRLQFEDYFEILTAASAEEGLRILREEPISVLLTDERMPGMSGIEMLSQVARHHPDVVRVIVSAYGDADRLLRAINVGQAHEYILKPWDQDDLHRCIERGLEMAQRRRVLSRRADLTQAYGDDLRACFDPARIVGDRSGLSDLLGVARKAARSDATVLIQGETGTGKELIARYIHENSPRASGPFVKVSCGALAEGVLESELFGHEKGAFTGAHRRRRGRFELAHGGTILLDEIGDISPSVQVALLRVLQERIIERVGGSPPIALDVRVLAATHRDLEDRVQQGAFRADLFYRVAVLPLVVPALRDRLMDIEPLVLHFIDKYAEPGRAAPTVEPDVIEALRAYSWPGNVRELENLVQRALVLSDGDRLDRSAFSFDLDALSQPNAREQARQVEKDRLQQLLLQCGGNCAEAARKLGIPRTTLVSRAKKFDLI